MNMNGLTAADYADTGQWRLILRIRKDGMSAHLENTLHEGIEPQELFSARWEADSEQMLRNIENAVYDHPRVLDDFSARIIIYDRKIAFMPTAMAEETEGAEENIFLALYDGDADDVMSESDGDITAAYAPAPGLKGFLNRTFPGARIGCNLMNMLRNVRKGEGIRLHIAVRDAEADFILLRGEELLAAVTHDCRADDDIIYHGFNLMDVYSLEPASTRVAIHGEADYPRLQEAFGKFCAGVDKVDTRW